MWAFLTTPTQKSLNQLLAFLNLSQHLNNQFIPSAYFWDIANFWVPSPDWPHQFLTLSTQKNFWWTLTFLWIYVNMQKISLFPSAHFSDTVKFRVVSPDWPHPFLTMLTPKIFDHLLICMTLCQHAKTQLIPSAHSWDKLNFRVQKPDWPQLYLTMSNQSFQSTINFCKFVSTCKELGCVIDLFWRNGRVKHPAIWLAEAILACISETRFFPNIGFMDEHRK